jgi:RNA polymerase sigma-70 factor (ECF subfamily)
MEVSVRVSAGTAWSVDWYALLPALTRYAKARLRNPTLADDAVAETLLAAVESGQTFASARHAAAWVYGVLRHKLVDQLRVQGRETLVGDLLGDSGDSLEGLADWDGSGAWSQGLEASNQPDQLCHQRQLLQLVARCCEQLPRLQRRAFEMRELHDAEAAQVCDQLGVTDGHLWVLIHRARLGLRRALRESGAVPEHLLQAAQPAPRRAAGTRHRSGSS